MTIYMRLLYITFHLFVRNIGCDIDKAIFDPLSSLELLDARLDFLYVHIGYCYSYLHHICLQDTISFLSLLCLLC